MSYTPNPRPWFVSHEPSKLAVSAAVVSGYAFFGLDKVDDSIGILDTFNIVSSGGCGGVLLGELIACSIVGIA